MKAKKRLIAFIIVLVVLGGAYFVIDAFVEKDDKKPIPLADKIGTPDTETQLVSIDSSTISSISYTSEGVQHQFDLINGVWTYVGIDNFPVSQNYVNNMCNAVSDIKYTRKFTDDAEITEYAKLDEPVCKIVVGYNDGKTDEYRLGTLNSTTESYYFSKSGDDAVYMVKKSTFMAMEKSIYDFVIAEEIPQIAAEDFSALSIHTSSGDMSFSPCEKDEFYSDMITWKSTENGVVKPADYTNIISFANDLMGVVLRDCVGYTDFDSTLLEKYGLDEPSAVYTVSSKNADDFVIKIGDSTDDGKVYLNIGGSKFIYKSTATFAESLQGKDARYFLPPSVCSMKLSSINNFTINYDGESHKFINDNGKYFVDGKEVPETPVLNFIIELSSMNAASYLDEDFSGEAEITIDFELESEKYPNMKLSLIPYDINYYLVDFAGMRNVLVTRRDVSSLIGVFKVMLDL